jgi:Fe-S cluster assembly protein SufD
MSALPSRRDEAWKWSDLRAAVGEGDVQLADEGDHIIERLARPLGAARRHVVPAGADETMRVHLAPQAFAAEALDVAVGEGATLTRLVLQTGAGVPLSLVRVRLAERARFRQFILSEGGRLARLETVVSHEGAGAEAQLAGVYVAASGAHADLTSMIVHKAPDTRTEQIVRGVARRGGRGVFQGMIEVCAQAAHVDARQRHDALLLEDGAEIFAKPELRIDCDDVQCAHGATVGALDPEALFYLRQRGIAEADARALLIEAFVGAAVPDWLDEAMRESVFGQIRSWLGRAS